MTEFEIAHEIDEAARNGAQIAVQASAAGEYFNVHDAVTGEDLFEVDGPIGFWSQVAEIVTVPVTVETF